MGFKDEMEQYDEQAASDADSRPTGGATLEDGLHQVMIVESRVEHDTTKETYTWFTKFQNSSGAVRKWQNLDNEVGRSIAVSDMRMLGHEGKLSELEDWCANEGPIGIVCEVRVKTKPGNDRDFKNVYINRTMGKGNPDDFQLDPDATPAAPAAASGAIDDDIPF